MSGSNDPRSHASKAVSARDETVIRAITDDAGRVIEPDWLAKSEAVHRQLRPHLGADYPLAMQPVFADGARMCIATRGDRVVGVAVHRIYVNTFDGRHMYVDDLVTDERERSSGVGRELLDHLQQLAKRSGCAWFTLDSGTQRHQAHKFYLREGMSIVAFHFRKPLA
ncbi:MAG: GNAT family N-acetyltransferase [Planctomycetes bacterium]|nr:GNAT family N-acetyltransferase [Planctomycetota bacterium]